MWTGFGAKRWLEAGRMGQRLWVVVCRSAREMATGECREGSVHYLVVGQLVPWRGEDVGREPSDLAEVPPMTNRWMCLLVSFNNTRQALWKRGGSGVTQSAGRRWRPYTESRTVFHQRILEIRKSLWAKGGRVLKQWDSFCISKGFKVVPHRSSKMDRWTSHTAHISPPSTKGHRPESVLNMFFAAMEWLQIGFMGSSQNSKEKLFQQQQPPPSSLDSKGL